MVQQWCSYWSPDTPLAAAIHRIDARRSSLGTTAHAFIYCAMSDSRYRTERPNRTKRGPLDFSRHARSVATDSPKIRAASCSVTACVSWCPFIGSSSLPSTQSPHPASTVTWKRLLAARDSVKAPAERRALTEPRAATIQPVMVCQASARLELRRVHGTCRKHQRRIRLGAADGRCGIALPFASRPGAFHVSPTHPPKRPSTLFPQDPGCRRLELISECRRCRHLTWKVVGIRPTLIGTNAI